MLLLLLLLLLGRSLQWLLGGRLDDDGSWRQLPDRLVRGSVPVVIARATLVEYHQPAFGRRRLGRCCCRRRGGGVVVVDDGSFWRGRRRSRGNDRRKSGSCINSSGRSRRRSRCWRCCNRRRGRSRALVVLIDKASRSGPSTLLGDRVPVVVGIVFGVPDLFPLVAGGGGGTGGGGGGGTGVGGSRRG